MWFNNTRDVYKTTSLKFCDINDMQNTLQKALMHTGITALVAYFLHSIHNCICHILAYATSFFVSI